MLMLAVLRRVIAVLILTAYASAALVQHVPFAHAMAGDMSTGMAQHQEGPSRPMPCKSTPQPCIADLGCVFLISLPAISDPRLLTLSAWASVEYPTLQNPLHGRSIKPALGPPISLT